MLGKSAKRVFALYARHDEERRDYRRSTAISRLAKVRRSAMTETK